ncbi:ABC transporter permease [Vagococcus entomophilus]|uniref:Peptide ABC transporter permease n=1 Tax=Vagococcus entomophilus TaxID=1160095 RepID=A0A430AFN0_9ENTE|nr:ABC transporter permease [Vagococcus entomophilus]RSU06532.1 peptide ABC transporter permease [Vagococcus entomophilus]
MEAATKFVPVSPKKIEEMERISQNQGIVPNEDGFLKTIVKRFLKDKLALIALICLLVLILVAIFSPLLAPYNPNKTMGYFEQAPSSKFWLGTDEVGRDVLSRLIYGARVSLIVGILSVVIYGIIGTTLGLLSGFLGGFWDAVIMRLTEVFMSFPYFMVILVIVSLIGPSIWTVTLVIGLLGWPMLCRLVRGEVMKLKHADYVQAAIASGYSTLQIVFKHIFPNVLSLILVNMTFGIASSIITEASLSFLGVGVQPPTASWGNMMSNAQSLTVLASQYWRWLPAGICILIAVLSVNFFGDGLRRAIEGESK